MFDFNAFMKRKGYSSQYEAAKAIGIHRSKIGAWCAGYRPPDYDDLCTLLRAGMTLNEAFGDELEEIILKGQPSLDLSMLTPEDCTKIVSIGLDGLKGRLLDK